MKGATKYILAILGVLIIAVIAYAVISGRGGGQAGSGSSSLVSQSGESTVPARQQASSADVQEFSNELLVLLTSLESISLDDSIFFNPAFEALRDITIPLLREGNEGRPNPFAPVGFTTPTGEADAPVGFDGGANQFSTGVQTNTSNSGGFGVTPAGTDFGSGTSETQTSQQTTTNNSTTETTENNETSNSFIEGFGGGLGF